MNRYGVAIIGCGGIHKTHAEILSRMKNTDIISVVDVIEERAAASAVKNNCEFKTDYRELLNDDRIDTVHLTTPHHLHAPMAVEFLSAGKHVLTEKPLAKNLEQAKMVAEEAKKSSQLSCISFQNRFNPTSQKAKELIESGTYGNILGIKGSVTWKRTPAYYTESSWRGSFDTEGGGVLINQSIHTLDLIQWLSGKKVKAIAADTSTRVLGDTIEVEDTADATIWFEDGVRGLFYATNCFSGNSPVEIDIHLEDATLKIWNNQLWEMTDKGCNVLTGNGEEENKHRGYWGTGHGKLINNFYKSIDDNNPSLNVTIDEGLITMQMLDAIYLSAATGNRINL